MTRTREPTLQVDSKRRRRRPPLEGESLGTPGMERKAQTAHGALQSKSRAGRYVLAFELASGGMATVFLARFEGAAGFTRPVALKRIHSHLSREQRFVEMFLDEARISSRLAHPNICAVQDFGQDDQGGYYLAMEYLAGETLGNVVRAALRADSAAPSTPRYRRLIAHLLAEACEGLHAAHEARGSDGGPLGVVHRDVTPNNLIVTFDGALKVVDFGIAKARDRVTRTGTGEFKGTLAYMSPEQSRSHDADHRSDIWSLGVCAWELLSGTRLFKRTTPAETLYAVLEHRVPRIGELQPTVPSVYGEVIAGALHRDPARRPATAREFGKALIAASEVDGARASTAEVGEWISELFPNGRVAKRELVERALRGDADIPAPPDASAARASEPEVAVEAPKHTPRGRAPLLLACVAAFGVAAWAMGGDSGETPEVHPPVPSPPVESSAGSPEPVLPVVVEVATEAAEEAEARETNDEEVGDESEPAPPRRPRRRRRAEPSSEGMALPAAAHGNPRMQMAPAESSDPPTGVGQGTIVIVVPDGWAEVFDGGRRLGQTPLRTSLASGAHTLDVRIEGRVPGRRVRANVRAGEVTRLVVRSAH